MSYRPVNDRILSARFGTVKGAVTICQVYAPTAEADDASIDSFYSELQQEISRVPRSDQIILMGDFNAKVGMGDEGTWGVMGRHGIGERNERGERLLDFCCVNNLKITNTRFKQTKMNRKWTWEAPDGNTHNLIDYIIVSSGMMSSVRNSRAFPSADVGSDHQLVMANIRLKLKVKRATKRSHLTNIDKLRNGRVREDYQGRINQRWEEMLNEEPEGVEEEWSRVKSIIQETSKEVLGLREGRSYTEWLSDATIKLMDERRKYKGKRKEGPEMAKHHNYLCRMVRKSGREDRERFIEGICSNVEESRAGNKTRAVYEGIRKITQEHAPRVKAVKDENGRVLSDPEDVKKRWKDYFDGLYNDANRTDDEYLENIAVAENTESIPTLGEDEVEAAINRMKLRKAPGLDNITTEELQAGTEGVGLKIIHRLCKMVWEREQWPSDWKRSIIIPIHKKKDRLDCSNYRGISLLCHCGKVFSTIILQRIRKRTEEILSEAQAGFRANRSTIDQIFTLRQIAEKYDEFGKDLYVCYIDFRKAFDSVWRRGLWRVMRHYGYPEKIVRLLESAYKDTFSAVRVDGELSEWFRTIMGVLQGCVLSPLLFNIFLELIMAIALEGTEEGAMIGGELISDLRFADDIALLGEKEEGLQESLTKVVQASKDMGMCINVQKTECQFIGRDETQMGLEVDGQMLEQKESFVYLGGLIDAHEGSEKDVGRRIGLARGILQRLHKVWRSKEISRTTKVRIYETLVLSVLLYNSETWTLKETQKRRLRVFETTCLRRIEGVTRRDRIRNTEIYSRLRIQRDIVNRIQTRRLRYFGHVTRMQNGRYPKVALQGYVHGKRRRGRPKKRWMDMIEEDCRMMGLTVGEATRRAQDRDAWRLCIKERPMRAEASPRP
jgi:hypothetical protein